jgi:hypothetical protein
MEAVQARLSRFQSEPAGPGEPAPLRVVLVRQVSSLVQLGGLAPRLESKARHLTAAAGRLAAPSHWHKLNLRVRLPVAVPSEQMQLSS